MSKISPLAVMDEEELMGWKPSDRPAEYWHGQAALAVSFAMARPASDLKGFCQALREATAFQKLAALAHIAEAA